MTARSIPMGEAGFGLLDGVGGLVVVLHTDGRIQYLNTACREATGYTLEEVRGQHIRDCLLLDMERASVQDLLAELARTGEPRRFENQWRTPSGEARWIVWEYRVIRDTEGSARWIVATGTDLGDRLRAERERCATRARDDLLSVVAHDLRGPLNAIHLSALVLERRLGEPRLTDRIHDGVRRMEQLIRYLLDISSLEAGHMQIEPAPVSMREILSDVLDTAKPLAAQRCVEFRLDVPEDPIVVHADRERIRQVLANLVDNAIKFTSQDGHVCLGARPRDGEVMVLVEDSGTGIEHNELPSLFERFRHRRRVAGGGSGLGLAICRGIVEAHGGKIWAWNRESGGAAFAFTLPARVHAG